MTTEKLVMNALFGKTKLASEKIELGFDFSQITKQTDIVKSKPTIGITVEQLLKTTESESPKNDSSVKENWDDEG